MKIRSFKSGSLLTLVIMMVFSISTLAQPGWGKRGQGQRQGLNKQWSCYQHIPDLTEEQEEQIESLRTKHWDVMSEYRSDMQTLRAQYHDMVTGKDRNLKKAESKIDEITGLKNKMMKERQNHREDVRNILNDEQKSYFDRMMHRRGSCMESRKGSGFGRGYGRGHGWHGRGQGWYGKPGGCDGMGPRWMDDDDD